MSNNEECVRLNDGTHDTAAQRTLADDGPKNQQTVSIGSYGATVTKDEKTTANGGQPKKIHGLIQAGDNRKDKATYLKLLLENRPFRLFIASYLVTHGGEWFTYVASMTAVEELLDENSTSSRTAISILVVVRMIPNIIWASFGGILADSRDRRESIIALDFLGAIVALSYLLAYQAKSIFLIYLVTFIQQTVAAFYEPCRSSIIPLMVPDDDFLKKATTLAGLAWSTMMAVGSGLGGMAVALLGIRACFLLDSVTYIGSALLMLQVGGSWNAAKERGSTDFKSMVIDGLAYLKKSFFGPLVLLKFSGGLISGACDVLYVSFSERDDDEAGNSVRLGSLFAFFGVGCVMGPLIVEPLIDMKNPSTIQCACVWSFAVISIGCLGMGWFTPFLSVCLFTLLRAAAASVIWVDSSLLLQKFSAPDMLGRVSAVDYGLATISEAFSAMLAGLMQDDMNLSAQEAVYVMAALGVVLFILWFVYHSTGHGAASAAARCDRS